MLSDVVSRIILIHDEFGICCQSTKRILDCHYDPEMEMEDFVVGSLRDIVHVAGRIELDVNGLPEKIIDVTDVRSLSSMAIRPDSWHARAGSCSELGRSSRVVDH